MECFFPGSERLLRSSESQSKSLNHKLHIRTLPSEDAEKIWFRKEEGEIKPIHYLNTATGNRFISQEYPVQLMKNSLGKPEQGKLLSVYSIIDKNMPRTDQKQYQDDKLVPEINNIDNWKPFEAKFFDPCARHNICPNRRSNKS